MGTGGALAGLTGSSWAPLGMAFAGAGGTETPAAEAALAAALAAAEPCSSDTNQYQNTSKGGLPCGTGPPAAEAALAAVLLAAAPCSSHKTAETIIQVGLTLLRR